MSVKSLVRSFTKALFMTTLGIAALSIIRVAVPVDAAMPTAGPEFRVNTYVLDHQQLNFTGANNVAADNAGNFVITWQSAEQDGLGQGIYAQRYNAAGVPQGPEFRVNTVTNDDQSYPSVAMDSSGDFVIAWQSNLQDGDSWGIYAQRYNAAGVPQGTEFQVNRTTASYQQYPSAAMNRAGNFVIAWQSFGQDGSGYGIYCQRYNSAGAALGGEFRVNSYTTDDQSDPSVAMDGVGNFLITWQSLGQDGSGSGIYAQRYTAAGAPQGSEFKVNTYTTSDQYYPAAAMSSGGSFVITWQSYGQDGSNWGIYTQRYDAAGTAQGPEFKSNFYGISAQSFPSAAMDSSGNFVITWQSNGEDGSGYGIYAQRYNSAGAADGSEIQVNTYTTGDQQFPSAAIDGSGNLVIAWMSNNQDGAGWGVYAQRYSSLSTPPQQPTITSAAYDANTHLLAVTGANMTAGDWIDVSKLSLTGQGGTTYTLTTPMVTALSSTSFSVSLNALDQLYLNTILNKSGTSALDSTAYNIGGAANWDITASSASDLTGNWVMVSAAATGSHRSRADFDGDGKTDVAVFRPSDGNWYQNNSSTGFAAVRWGQSGDVLVPGDYDGDGKADFSIWRPSNLASVADFYVLKSSSFTITGMSHGDTSDIPVAGDFDGDGKADFAVFRPSIGYWFVNYSSTNLTSALQFGATGDVPFAMDNDGDGRSNLAVYRPSNGTWYIARPTGTPSFNFDAALFGQSGDVIVPADYDGDNKDDIAVFRPSNGVWYIRRSSDGVVIFPQFGRNGDIPVPGDYDGDGKNDIAVYRSGVWYINRSTSGFTAVSFGVASDVPVPARYHP